MGYVIGIDGGTESLRAHVFDMAGRDLGGAASAYQTTFQAPARAEQDPREWWRALGEATRRAVQVAGVRAGDIEALALDTTSATVVVTDAEGNPLRAALLWMDVRAADEADAVLQTRDPALRLNGAGKGPVSPEWMIPKALWLKRHERPLYDRAATICEYQDFLVRRLTGRSVASLCTASIRWHYRSREGGWPESLLAAVDLEDLRLKWPREVVSAGELVGPLTAEAADHLGLTTSTSVIQGGADAFIGAIGLGVARPGQLALITGSSHLQLAVTDEPVSVPGLWGSYADVVYPGRHVLEGGQNATGSMIAWLRRFIGTDVDFDRLNGDAAKVPVGSDGLTVLDHFQGNRTPYTDAHSRGALVGLSLGHGRAHIYRAMLEAICFGTRSILDTMSAAGLQIDEIVAAGGATRSPLWMQIHADVAKRRVAVTTFADAPVLGSAVLAAVGAGHYPSIDAAISAMVKVDRVIEVNRQNAEAYDELYGRYERLYGALKEWREGRP